MQKKIHTSQDENTVITMWILLSWLSFTYTECYRPGAGKRGIQSYGVGIKLYNKELETSLSIWL